MAEPRSAAEEARDPSTPPERLLELTEKHPQLQKLIVLNPSCPEVARQWILATNPWAKAAYDESTSSAGDSLATQQDDDAQGGTPTGAPDETDEPDAPDEPDEVSVWGDFFEDDLEGDASQDPERAARPATSGAGTATAGGSGPVTVRVAEDRGVVPLGPVNPSDSPSTASPSPVGLAGAGATGAGAVAAGASAAAGSHAAPASPPAAQASPPVARASSPTAPTSPSAGPVASAAVPPAAAAPTSHGPAPSGPAPSGPSSSPAPSPSTASAPPSAGPDAASPALGAAAWQGPAAQHQHPSAETPTAAYGLPAFSGPAAAQYGAAAPPPPPESAEPGDSDPSRRRLWFACGGCLLLALVLLIVGGFGARALLAGNDDEYQRDSTTTAEDSPSSAPEEEPTTTKEESPSKDPVSPAPDDAQKMNELRSPSGNITCQLEKDTVACSIVDRSFSGAGLQDCSDGPFSLKVSKGTAVRACGSSYLSDTAETLEYEQSAKHGNTACTSRSEGMTCWNTNTGHGFSVNRASYETF